MILYAIDRIICVRFLLNAGFAESNTSLNTMFNQHRSTFFSSFCKSFNSFTEKFPADLILPVRVFMPLPGSSLDNCSFILGTPRISFFFKKLNIFSSYFSSSFFSCFFNVLELFKLSLLKSLHMFFFSNTILRYCFLSIVGSMSSFIQLNSLSAILFKTFILKSFGIISYYSIFFSLDFIRIFFIS